MSPIASPAAIAKIREFRAKGARIIFSRTGDALAYIRDAGDYYDLMPDGTLVFDDAASEAHWERENDGCSEAAIERRNDEWASREDCPWWAQ